MIPESAVQSAYENRYGDQVEVPVEVQHTVSQLLNDACDDITPFDLGPKADNPPLARRRRWGVHLQLAPLVDDSTWGIGDYGSLVRLGQEVVTHGADFVAIGPTNWESILPDGGLDSSPYSPVSRLLHSLLHVEVTTVAGWSSIPPADRKELCRRGAQLNAASAARRDDLDVLKLKAEALRSIFAHNEPQVSGIDPRSSEGLLASALVQYLQERRVAAHYFGTLDEKQHVEFLVWLQHVVKGQLAVAHEELRAAGMDIGIVADLQVGASQDGIDQEVFSGCYSRTLSIGTPPDDYVPDGQNWRLAFPVPHRDQHRPCAQRLALATVVVPVGGVRIDHVLGIQRLWARLPDGAGTYVHFDVEAQMESIRELVDRGKLVVGEDLGNVPDGLREVLAESGVYGTDVVWWTRGTDGSLRTGLTTEGREQSMLLIAFHDTSSTACFITGEDLRLLDSMGRLGRDLTQAEKQRFSDLAEFGVGPNSDAEDALLSIYTFAFSSRPELVSIYYPDLLGLECTENVPGTGPEDHPNWVLTYGDPDLSIEEQLGGKLARQLLALKR
ncbi:4-alpha-glucanotransferase [Arthrobacter sp. M2012083]|uniref:4-alpha-glucanotransferase n=1 Tax=Arthrobacter sp. M2012083 TaxID=1197706 RepID=UPI0002F5A4B0|nr:4-alpha-glucanotransferase [Arthrobacter sp. M2012083]